MQNTITEKLSKNMQAAKVMQEKSLKMLSQAQKVAERRHDAVASKIKELEKRMRDDPENAQVGAQHDQLMDIKSGLLAASEFSRRTVELEMDHARNDQKRHAVRDHRGKFTMTGGHGHFLGALLKPTKM